MKTVLLGGAALVALLSLQTALSLDNGDRSSLVDACSRLSVMRANLADMLKRYTEEHPDVIALRSDIARLVATLRADGANSPEEQLCPPTAKQPKSQ